MCTVHWYNFASITAKGHCTLICFRQRPQFCSIKDNTTFWEYMLQVFSFFFRLKWWYTHTNFATPSLVKWLRSLACTSAAELNKCSSNSWRTAIINYNFAETCNRFQFSKLHNLVPIFYWQMYHSYIKSYHRKHDIILRFIIGCTTEKIVVFVGNKFACNMCRCSDVRIVHTSRLAGNTYTERFKN